jgi:DnaK suppressor protein
MQESDISYFKGLLEKQLKDLLQQASHSAHIMREAEANTSDPLDRAIVDAEHSYRLRFRGREYTLIKKIKRSLDDIENGDFGICEDCGEDISIARLMARPVASRCIKCKTKQEELEKVYG